MKRYFFALLAVFCLGGCSKVLDPEFRRLEHFRLKNLGLVESSIGFNVTYLNPNNFTVTAKEAAIDLYLDSVFLGRFTQDSAVAVSKKSEFSIPFTGRISMQKALSMNFENIGNRDILVRAEGNVKVGKAGIFVNRPVKYEGRHRLDQIKFR